MMKNSQPPVVRKIRSMQELKQEKARLRRETKQTEEKIREDYKLLIDAFTIRNLLTMVMEEVTKTSNVFSQAFQIGKSIFKKKKKKKMHTDTDGTEEAAASPEN